MRPTGTAIVFLVLAGFAMQGSIARSDPAPAKSYRVQGTIVDASGAPVDWGFVLYPPVLPKGEMWMDDFGWPTTPIHAGRFEFVVHSPGTYVLIVRPSGRFSFGVPSTPRTVVIASDTTVHVVADAYVVQGTVWGREREPLYPATVHGGGGGAWVDVNGHYRMLVTRGPCRLGVQPGDVSQQSWRSDSLSISGPRTVDVHVDYVEWAGFVRMADTGTPVDSVRVYAWERDPKGGMVAYSESYFGKFQLSIRRGQRFDLYAEDMRGTDRAFRGRRDEIPPQRLETSMILDRWVEGVASTRDTSLTILVNPAHP